MVADEVEVLLDGLLHGQRVRARAAACSTVAGRGGCVGRAASSCRRRPSLRADVETDVEGAADVGGSAWQSGSLTAC